jgi:hypothetical protein
MKAKKGKLDRFAEHNPSEGDERTLTNSSTKWPVASLLRAHQKTIKQMRCRCTLMRY